MRQDTQSPMAQIALQVSSHEQGRQGIQLLINLQNNKDCYHWAGGLVFFDLLNCSIFPSPSE
jgi:hypothetical protein